MVKKVLFLAANPLPAVKIALGEEMRLIEQKVRATDLRDELDLKSAWAVRPLDLIDNLNRYKPHIVHFSGRGSKQGELIFQGEDGLLAPVDTRTLENLFGHLKDNIRLIVLNACYSRKQASALVKHIDCVVGMKAEITDEAAATFAAYLYSALGFGRSIKQAFEQGRLALALEGIPEEHIPILFVRDGVDADQILLFGSETIVSSRSTVQSQLPSNGVITLSASSPAVNPTLASDRPIEIFISCADKDRDMLDDLIKHLKVLRRERPINYWHRGDILPGAVKDKVIQSHLEAAQLILLLISPEYLQDDLLYEEMRRVVAWHGSGRVAVLPILFRRIAYDGMPFAHLEVLPSNGKFVSQWKSKEQAFDNITAGIKKVVTELIAQRS